MVYASATQLLTEHTVCCAIGTTLAQKVTTTMGRLNSRKKVKTALVALRRLNSRPVKGKFARVYVRMYTYRGVVWRNSGVQRRTPTEVRLIGDLRACRKKV